MGTSALQAAVSQRGKTQTIMPRPGKGLWPVLNDTALGPDGVSGPAPSTPTIKHPEESGSWEIARDINNMPDRSAFRNTRPRSKYGKLFLPARVPRLSAAPEHFIQGAGSRMNGG